MGYRSEVVIRIGFRDIDEMNAFIAHMMCVDWSSNNGFSANINPFTMFKNHFMVDSQMCCMEYEMDNIKWYEDYIDVSAIDWLFRHARDIVPAISKLVRIGENDEDIESEEFYSKNANASEFPSWSWVMDMYVVRHIESSITRSHAHDLRGEAYIEKLSEDRVAQQPRPESGTVTQQTLESN